MLFIYCLFFNDPICHGWVRLGWCCSRLFTIWCYVILCLYTDFVLLLFFSFDIQGFRQAQTMAFAVDEINRNSKLLPNISLGYSLYDSCVNLGISFHAALSMTSGRGEPFQLNERCYGYPPLLGIVAGSTSTYTIAISSILSLYSLPMVSQIFEKLLVDNVITCSIMNLKCSTWRVKNMFEIISIGHDNKLYLCSQRSVILPHVLVWVTGGSSHHSLELFQVMHFRYFNYHRNIICLHVMLMK